MRLDGKKKVHILRTVERQENEGDEDRTHRELNKGEPSTRWKIISVGGGDALHLAKRGKPRRLKWQDQAARVRREKKKNCCFTPAFDPEKKVDGAEKARTTTKENTASPATGV